MFWRKYAFCRYFKSLEEGLMLTFWSFKLNFDEDSLAFLILQLFGLLFSLIRPFAPNLLVTLSTVIKCSSLQKVWVNSPKKVFISFPLCYKTKLFYNIGPKSKIWMMILGKKFQLWHKTKVFQPYLFFSQRIKKWNKGLKTSRRYSELS
jgi:hypothetical protein